MGKRTLTIAVVVVLSIVGFFIFNIFYSPSALPSNCPDTKNTVTMQLAKGRFTPTDVQIKRCTTIIFKNTDTMPHWPASDFHPTHGTYPEFDPLVGIAPGKEWAFTFDKVGKWKYHDHLYPMIHGVIAVTE